MDIQYENNSNNIEKWGITRTEWDPVATFDCHWQIMKFWIGTKAFVAAVMRLSFYEIYQRGLYHVALLATFNVVTWKLHIESTSLSATCRCTGQLCGSFPSCDGRYDLMFCLYLLSFVLSGFIFNYVFCILYIYTSVYHDSHITCRWYTCRLTLTWRLIFVDQRDQWRLIFVDQRDHCLSFRSFS